MGKLHMKIKTFFVSLVTMLSLCLVGCNSGNTPVTPDPAVRYVTLNKTELTLKEGQKDKLEATVTADEGAQYTLSWSSSDSEVVSVDSSGNISAIKAGLAVIIAAAGEKNASCNVEVIGKDPEPEVTKYTISFDANGGTGKVADIEMEKGKYILPENPFNPPEGKEFKCWEVNGQEMNVGEVILITSNTVIKAIWRDIPVVLKNIVLSNVKTNYQLNDTFEKPTVTASYSNNTSKDVTNSATFTGYNLAQKGNQTVSVSYTEGEVSKTLKYQIYVKDPQDDVQTYTISFSPNGGTGTMSSLTVEEGEIDQPECLFTAPNGKVFDAWKIQGQENPLEQDAKINVTSDIVLVAIWKDNPKNLSSIAISNAKTEYTQNDVFVKPTVTATLLDGTTKDVSSSATFTGYDTSKVGQQTVTVSYTENDITKTTTYTITIKAPTQPSHRDGDTYANTEVTTKAVPNMDDEFILGMDASAVPSLENSGVKYYDFDGQEADVFEILSDNGINYIRVRIWNNPYDSNGNGYGGGNCDVDNAIAIGKRATQYSMKLLVDFHYSDFWADPAKQTAPKAWSSYTLEQKKTAIYEFTKDTLQEMKNENIDVGMVQVGNETNNGNMCGETGINNFIAMAKKGSAAVREVFPSALVAVHFANPLKYATHYVSWARSLKNNGLDYDVFGTSYYPYWHGTLDNLTTVMNNIASETGKKVMVMETSYAYTTDDTDFHGNSSPKDNQYTPHDISVQGQYDQINDVISTVKNSITNGIGVCYWEGTWISVGTTSWEINRKLWEANGSGWASSYSAEYDPDDAGKYYGGCAVDNQAFFSEKGNVLNSIKIFNRNSSEEGGDTPEPEQTYTLNISLTLTTTPTNAVSLIYSINGNTDYINTAGLSWHEMTKNGNTYTFDLSNIKEGDVVRYCFATWTDSGNLYLDGSNDWKAASYTMLAANKTLTCTATSFPADSSTCGVFEVE